MAAKALPTLGCATAALALAWWGAVACPSKADVQAATQSAKWLRTHSDARSMRIEAFVEAPDDEAARLRQLQSSGHHRELQRRALRLSRQHKGEVQARFRWFEAAAQQMLGRSSLARRRWDDVGRSTSPLAPWARLRRIELDFSRGADANVVSQARAVAREDFPGALHAATLAQRSALRVSPRSASRQRAKAFLKKHGINKETGWLAVELGEDLQGSGRASQRAAGRELWLRALELGRHPAARTALEHLAAWQRRHRSGRIKPDFALAAAIAEASLSQRSHRRDAAKGLDHLLRDKTLQAEQRCRAKALLAELRREKSLKALRSLRDDCPAGEARAPLRFRLASQLRRKKAFAEALAEYDALVEEAPKHSLSPQALLLAAVLADEAGDRAGWSTRLQQLLQHYPREPEGAEAGLRLGLGAFLQGDYAAAVQSFGDLEAAKARWPEEGAWGRHRYWLARSLAAHGQSAAAIDTYRKLTEDRPLSFYGQRSLERLQQLSPAATRETAAALQRLSATASAPFAKSLHADADFRRALELQRVGDNNAFESEVAALRKRGHHQALEALAWLAHHAGESRRGLNLSRPLLRGSTKPGPTAARLRLWRLAYPFAYDEPIRSAAAQEQLPVALVRAVAREESHFHARALSRANAYGIMQVIRPTARQYGRELRLPTHPSALFRPEINIPIGAHFMAYLWSKYHEQPMLIPPAYNAGPGAADRWLRERGELATDLWIETIPYKETRRYTRRVMQTYGVYQWLESGRTVALPPMVRQHAAR